MKRIFRRNQIIITTLAVMIAAAGYLNYSSKKEVAGAEVYEAGMMDISDSDILAENQAKNGVDDTTMNDIAVASKKGRRTLYTYFKSKEDIYYAVIEGELERLSDKLDEVAAKKVRPQDKIIELIYTHLSMIKETVVRNGNLRAAFFRNIWMVEKVRKNFDEDEIELFRKVYEDGKRDGEFDIDNVELVADITHYCIKGLEVPYICGRLGHGITPEASKPLVAKVVYGALGKITSK